MGFKDSTLTVHCGPHPLAWFLREPEKTMSAKSAVKKAPIAKKAAFDPHRFYSSEELAQFVQEELEKEKAERGPGVAAEIASRLREIGKAAAREKNAIPSSVTPGRIFRVLWAAQAALWHGASCLDEVREGIDQEELTKKLAQQYGHTIYTEKGLNAASDLVSELLQDMAGD